MGIEPGLPSNRYCECTSCQERYCIRCAFMMVPGPSYLQEPMGASYLAYDARNPDDLHDCPQKHKMKYFFTNLKHLVKYNCGKCNDQFFYNSDFGMEGCDQCNYFLCGSCSGVKRAKVSDTYGIELVSHFAESYAT